MSETNESKEESQVHLDNLKGNLSSIKHQSQSNATLDFGKYTPRPLQTKECRDQNMDALELSAINSIKE